MMLSQRRIPPLLISIWFLTCFSVGFITRLWDLSAFQYRYTYTWRTWENVENDSYRGWLRQRFDGDEFEQSDDVSSHPTLDDSNVVNVVNPVPEEEEEEYNHDNNVSSSNQTLHDLNVEVVNRIPEQNNHEQDQYQKHQSPDTGTCIPIHTSKQFQPHPNANTIHELNFFSNYISNTIQYLAHGGFNSIFVFQEEISGESIVVKSLTYFRKHDEQQFHAVQHDSMIMEALSSSPHIIHMYAYCGSTVLVPYISGGTLQTKLKQWHDGEMELDTQTRLQYGIDVAAGLRDLHDVHVIHGDLHELQYLFAREGSKKLILSDFNKSQLGSRSSLTGKPCTYKAPYINKRLLCRSPEEYSNSEQSSAGDVFAMGNLFYYLLTGKSVWMDWLGKKYLKRVRRWITNGKVPKMEEDIWMSTDVAVVALRGAFEMCTKFDPVERATAQEVLDYLESAMDKLNS